MCIFPHIVLFNSHFPIKAIRNSKDNDFSTEAKKISGGLRVFLSRNEKCTGRSKGHNKQIEVFPNVQVWSNSVNQKHEVVILDIAL